MYRQALNILTLIVLLIGLLAAHSLITSAAPSENPALAGASQSNPIDQRSSQAISALSDISDFSPEQVAQLPWNSTFILAAGQNTPVQFNAANAPAIRPPTDLRADPGISGIELRWQPSPSHNLKGYRVYRGLNSGDLSGFTLVSSELATGDRWIDRGQVQTLQPRVDYYYYLVAEDTSGHTSAPSELANNQPGQSPSPARKGELRIFMPDSGAKPGETITVPVKIGNADGLIIDSMDVWVTYNPAVLVATQVNKTTLLRDYAFMANTSLAGQGAAAAIILATGNKPTLYGEATLFEITFQVSGTAPMTSLLNLPLTFTVNANTYGTTIYWDITEPWIPLVRQSSIFTITQAESFMLGDVEPTEHGDSDVDQADAQMAMALAVGNQPPNHRQEQAGDLNGDERINSADAALIVRQVGGLSRALSAPYERLMSHRLTAAGQVITLTVGDGTAMPGGGIALPVSINAASQVAGVDLAVNYDPNTLVFNHARLGELATPGFSITFTQGSTQTVKIALAPKTAGATIGIPGTGTLAYLDFTVKPEARPGYSAVTLAVARLNDGFGRDLATSDIQVPVRWVQGHVNIPPPLSGVSIAGATCGVINSDYDFVAAVSPPTATTPITYTWQTPYTTPVTHISGLSDTISLAWNAAGSYPVTVTAATVGSIVTNSHTILVAAAPQAPTWVTISGKTSGKTNTNYTFEANISPVTSTQPVTYTWDAIGQATITHINYSPNDTATFKWPLSGTYTVTLTAANASGTVTNTHTIAIHITQTQLAPIAGVIVDGPTTGVVNTAYTFTAALTPTDVVTPVIYIWQATGQSPRTNPNGGISDTVAFRWNSVGQPEISVTATNVSGTVKTKHRITINLAIRGVTLTPAAATQSGAPGAVVTYQLQARNTGNTIDSFTANLSSVAWTAHVTPTIDNLLPGASAHVVVSVHIPLEAVHNQSDSITLTVASAAAPSVHATAVLTTNVVVQYGAALLPDKAMQVVNPGDQTIYTLHLRNTGNVTQSYKLSRIGYLWPTSLSSDQISSIGPGQSVPIQAVVSVPGNAIHQQNSVAHIEIQRIGNTDVLAASTLTTIAVTDTIKHGLALRPDALERAAVPAQSVAYTLRFTNTGSVTDTLTLSLSGDWAGMVSPEWIVLGSDQGQSARVVITTPAQANTGQQAQNTLTVISMSDPATQVAATLTTKIVDTLMHIILSEAKVDVGSPVSASVAISNVSNLGYFQFKLFYDPSLVTIHNLSVGNFPGSTGRIIAPAIETDNNKGEALFIAFSTGSAVGPSGAGTLADFQLRTRAAGPVVVYLEDAQCQNVQNQPIPVAAQDATLHIVDNKKRIYLPLILKQQPILPNAPILEPITPNPACGEYTLSWSEPDNMTVTHYILQEATSNTFSDATRVYSGTSSSYLANNVTPGRYYYRVTACGAPGCGRWSNSESVSISSPNTPTLQPINNPNGYNSYSVSWSDSGVSTTYALQEARNSNFTSPTDYNAGQVSSYDVSQKEPTRYYYRVKGHNTCGDSDWSQVQSVDVLWEMEPNDDGLEAKGPMLSGLTYYGIFPSDIDEKDYYYIELSEAHVVEAWLTNIADGQNYDLALRYTDTTPIAFSRKSGNADEYITSDKLLPPGRYHVQVYRASQGGNTQPYHLKVVYK